jgi:hypothetical protein
LAKDKCFGFEDDEEGKRGKKSSRIRKEEDREESMKERNVSLRNAYRRRGKKSSRNRNAEDREESMKERNVSLRNAYRRRGKKSSRNRNAEDREESMKERNVRLENWPTEGGIPPPPPPVKMDIQMQNASCRSCRRYHIGCTLHLPSLPPGDLPYCFPKQTL